MDWSSYYPAFVDEEASKDESISPRMKQDVEIVDIGCGFGGLLVGLAPILSDKLILGESSLFLLSICPRKLLLTSLQA
jgi:sorting nexin-25